jgi:ATP-dependent RNA helicase DeaD
VNTVILDEADEMLNMGFLDSINEILEEVPEYRRTLLFSATMSSEIASIARKYMTDPVEVTIGTKNSSAENVTHNYFLVHARDKYKVLKRIADSEPDIYAIVFCRTRKDTQEVASKLISDGYNADALHGDLSQAQRDTVMQKFRSKSLHMLVATDVAARGLDVDDITHVINYSLPEDTEVYTHRSGRTGRAGKTGVSVSLVHLKEKELLHRIEKMIKKPFRAMPVPTGEEICGKQLFNWVNRLENVQTNHLEIEKYLPEIKQRLENLDREELLRRVVSLEFDRFLDDYRNGEDLIENVSEKGFERIRSDKNVKYARLFINLGKTDGLFAEQLIELVNSKTKGKKIPIGKIDLMKSFSFFEIEERSADDLIRALENTTYLDRKVIVEIAQERNSKPERKEYRSRKKSAWSQKGNGKKGHKESRRAYSR